MLASLVLGGCAVAQEPDAPIDLPDVAPTVPVAPQTTVYGEEEQGVYLLGNLADRLARNGKHLAVVAPQGLTIRVDGQALVVRSGGVSISPVNLVLPAADGTGALRIDAIDPAGAGYQISYLETPASAGTPYCDAAESLYAIPIQGEWTTTGLHDQGTMVTFACQESGKAAKCESFGYVPETVAGAGPTWEYWDLHQACTQMAMANFCVDGVSHTREKTKILVRDAVLGAEPPNAGDARLDMVPSSYPPVPPPPDLYFFEAAWEPRRPVLCLHKLRWNSMPIGGPCPGVLADPRLDPDARFCEEANLDLPQHYLLSGSRTQDLAMHTWTSGSDTLTTVHGYVYDAKSRRVTQPPAGFRAPPLSADGFLLRNLTGTLDEAAGDVIRVYRLRNPSTGDTVVGPAGMLSGYSHNPSGDFEGFLLTKPGLDTAAFYLYRNDKNIADYVTATRPPKGFTQVRLLPLGHVIARAP